MMKEHPFSGKQGYVAEHRLVMEQHIGRFLQPMEVVHHKNSKPDDNRIENLELFSSPGVHAILAHPNALKMASLRCKGRAPWNKNRIRSSCAICDKEFERTANHIRLYCSRKCFNVSQLNKRVSEKSEFKKGFIPWNKGKTPNEATRHKMKVAALRRWAKS
jgi:endogenous inhibitor of DNA gyrase (YacG/DUF329 family)